MASSMNQATIDLEEQLARIQKMREETDRISQETRKLMAETKVVSYATIFQGLIAIAALLGAGAALAKLFFS